MNPRGTPERGAGEMDRVQKLNREPPSVEALSSGRVGSVGILVHRCAVTIRYSLSRPCAFSLDRIADTAR